jgi:palmitoyltransferase
MMLSFHIWGIAIGETSVESHDFPLYSERAKSRGNAFVNCYDLGYTISSKLMDITDTRLRKRQNIELFFNVGPHGE